MDVKCPQCGQPVVHDANSAGRSVGCPGCAHQFQMPNLPRIAGSKMPIWILGVLLILVAMAVFRL